MNNNNNNKEIFKTHVIFWLQVLHSLQVQSPFSLKLYKLTTPYMTVWDVLSRHLTQKKEV